MYSIQRKNKQEYLKQPTIKYKSKVMFLAHDLTASVKLVSEQ